MIVAAVSCDSGGCVMWSLPVLVLAAVYFVFTLFCASTFVSSYCIGIKGLIVFQSVLVQ